MGSRVAIITGRDVNDHHRADHETVGCQQSWGCGMLNNQGTVEVKRVCFLTGIAWRVSRGERGAGKMISHWTAIMEGRNNLGKSDLHQ